MTNSIPKTITIDSTLYAGVDFATAQINIDDTCSRFRIKDKLYSELKDDDGTAVEDTLPGTVTTLTNPVFSADFSIIVTDDSILTYTAGTSPNPGSYAVDRSGLTYNPTKSVWKNDKNFIVFTKKETAGKWSFTVQINKLVDSAVSKSIGDFSGETTGEPTIIVSPKLMKVFVYGKLSTDATKPFYFAKTINYDTQTVKDIVLTDAIKNDFNEIVMTDDILYVRNTQTQTKKHFGYLMMGKILIKSFDENVSPLILTTEYTRTFIKSTSQKIILYCQMKSDNWMYIVKTQLGYAAEAAQILLPPTPVLGQMTFDFESKYHSTSWGKWIKQQKTVANATKYDTAFNYIEYDPNNVTTYKKVISKTINTVSNDYNLFGVSPNMTCFMVYSGTDKSLKLFSVDTTTSVITQIADVFTTVEGFYTAAQIKTAIDNKLVSSGNSCWTFTFQNILFVKNSGSNVYARSAVTVSSAWKSYTFDSTLKYVLAAGKLFKYVYDYEQLFTVSALKANRSVLVNEAEDKIIIFSYQPDTEDLQTSYTGNVKVYYKKDNIWTKISKQLNVGTIVGEPILLNTPDFNVIGIQYNNGSEGTEKKSIVKLYKLDLTLATPGFTQFTYPDFFSMNYDKTKAMKFSFVNTYLSVINPQLKSQKVYKINMSELKFQQIANRPLSDTDLTNIKRVEIKEESSKVIQRYEFVQINTLHLIRRQLETKVLFDSMSVLPKRQFGFFISGDKFIPCSAGCSSCLSVSTCTACLPGFALNSKFSCVRCNSLCQSCSATDTSVCLTPINGFYLDAGVSKKCHADCVKCTSQNANNCTVCKLGSYRDNSPTGTCKPCIQNCVSCSDSVGCNTCRLGYVYNPILKKCFECLSGCTACKYDKVYECSQCSAGYESVITNNVTTGCSKCPQNCLKCSSGKCTECSSGFKVKNSKCVKLCVAPCLECSDSNSSVCTSCLDGFKLDGQACKPDLSCATGKTCKSCPLNYTLVGGECLSCDAGSNCVSCARTNFENCTVCSKGYYLNSTFKCNPCALEGCVDCTSPSLCSQCQDGYVLSSSEGTDSKCVKCDSICGKCRGSPDNCETCATGYTLKGWKCVKDSNVKFDVKLDGDFISFKTQQYQKITESIATLLNLSKTEITITALKSGSIIVVGTVNAPSSAAQTTMLATLNTGLSSSGSSIGGLPVQTFSLTTVSTNEVANNTTPNPNPNTTPSNVYINDGSGQKRYRDIAIIVGIVIPVGLIIIFLVLILLYKKGLLCVHDVKINSANEQTFAYIKDSSAIKLEQNPGEKKEEKNEIPNTEEFK